MFGQDIIVGHYNVKIDGSNRLLVPAFTYREPGDKLFAQTYKCNNGYALKLYSEREFIGLIKKLEQLKENASSIEEFYKVKTELEMLYNKFSAYFIVSKQNRVTLPSSLMEALNWENDEYYRCDGLGNSILVRKK